MTLRGNVRNALFQTSTVIGSLVERKKKTEEQPNRKKPSIEDHSCQRSPSVMGEFCWPDPTQIAKKKDAFQSNKLASPTHLFFSFFTLTKRTSLPPVDRLCVSTKDCIGKIRNDGEELSVTLVLFFFFSLPSHSAALPRVFKNP